MGQSHAAARRSLAACAPTLTGVGINFYKCMPLHVLPAASQCQWHCSCGRRATWQRHHCVVPTPSVALAWRVRGARGKPRQPTRVRACTGADHNILAGADGWPRRRAAPAGGPAPWKISSRIRLVHMGGCSPSLQARARGARDATQLPRAWPPTQKSLAHRVSCKVLTLLCCSKCCAKTPLGFAIVCARFRQKM